MMGMDNREELINLISYGDKKKEKTYGGAG